MNIFVLAAAAAPPAAETGLGWLQWVVNVGVAGAMLYFVLAKVIPKILASHREALEKEEARHAKQEDMQREQFIDTINKVEAAAAERDRQFIEALQEERRAREAQLKETTAVGHQQATAVLELSGKMETLSTRLSENTDVLRSLQSGKGPGRYPTGKYDAVDKKGG